MTKMKAFTVCESWLYAREKLSELFTEASEKEWLTETYYEKFMEVLISNTKFYLYLGYKFELPDTDVKTALLMIFMLHIRSLWDEVIKGGNGKFIPESFIMAINNSFGKLGEIAGRKFVLMQK
jgi:hypothetical protein